MARTCRKRSNTGIYHIMLRGIDKRNIFFDDEDREVYLSYLARTKEKCNCMIYGYCLMDNHVHLLIGEGQEHIGESVKRLAVGYVQWHNAKYSRSGHLFQNRYKSEAVEDDSYFVTVLRYIHQNPLKAGLVKDLSQYKWSSYKGYLKGSQQELVSVGMANSFFTSLDKFIEFMKTPSNDQCLEDEVKIKYTDEKLRNEIIRIYNKPELIVGMPKEARSQVIKHIQQSFGVSNRQLSRVLGIGRGIIDRI